jgi:hypothetical protein
MRQIFFYCLIVLLTANCLYGQVVVIPFSFDRKDMPEHGFLPGKSFPLYSTINKYDLKNRKLRVELYDDRENLKLNKVECSQLEFTNTSEFASPSCIYKIEQYLDTLLSQNGANIDSTSNDILQVRLEGIDTRLIGFGKIKVHGLCQMKFNYHDFSKTYCIDIVDGDKHSPLGSNAFVTRKTATRYLTSAAIREVIEQFFSDFQSMN